MKLFIVIFSLSFFSYSQVQAQKNNEQTSGYQKRYEKKVARFDQQGIQRTYTIFSPKNIPDNEKLPAVFLFHGGGGNMNNFAKKTKWLDTEDDVIFVFLQAATVCITKEGTTTNGNYWLNSRKLEQLCEGSPALDEIAYLDRVFENLKTHYPIDTQSVFASGFSNGCGLILQTILVKRPYMFKAYAGVGSLPQLDYYTGLQADVPLYISAGQQDDVLLKHTEEEKFTYTYNGILQEPIFSNTVDYLCPFLNLETDYETEDGEGCIRLVYAKGESNRSLLVIELMEHMSHLFPAGKKRHNNIIMAERHWQFFQNHRKIKKRHNK